MNTKVLTAVGAMLILPLSAFAWARNTSPTTGATYWWGENPKIWTNSDTPANLRPKIADGINAWKWSGAGRYPYAGGVVGRDCGDGDSWWYDNDDGYNVVDYYHECDDGIHGWFDFHCGNAEAFSRPIDEYNSDWGRLAEVDIVMCTGKNWSDNYNYAGSGTGLSYQGTITHELGHLMGFHHSDLNPSTQVVATMHMNKQITDAGLEYARTYDKSSLSWDDVDGIRSIYGSCGASDWVVTDFAGQYVTIEAQSGSGYDCGVDYSIDIKTPGTGWTPNPVAIRNSRLGGWVKPNTVIEWSEIDWSHSNIVTLMVTGADGVQRELNYARNAGNHWYRQGWAAPVNADGGYDPFYDVYGAWRNCRGHINADYLSEYGVNALYVNGVYVKHFVDTNLPAHKWQRSWTDGFRIQRR